MKKFIADIKKYYRYSIYTSKSTLKSEVANSYLSWIWWLLDPLLFMLVYSFVAKIVFNRGEPYFNIYVLIGLTTFAFFNKTVTASVKIVRNNSAIVSKVYLPKYILVLTKLLVNAFKMMFSYIIIVVLLIASQVPISYRVIYVVPILFVVALITFGVSTIMAHFGVFIDDLSNIIQVLLRLVFYMSGIFYSIKKDVPYPYNEILLKGNPLAFSMQELRNVILYRTDPDIIFLLIWMSIGFILSYIGIVLIYKNENNYVKVI